MKNECKLFVKAQTTTRDASEFIPRVARLGLKGINIAKGIKGEKEMKKIMIDNRNAKIIAFALVAVLLLIGTVGLASALAGQATVGGSGGLVAYYPFNGDAKDKSGNGNDGTVYGATWVDNGGCGKALSFDGDAYVEVPNSNSLNLLDELTIEAWVKPTNWGGAGYGRIVDKGNAYVLHITQSLYGGKSNSFSLSLYGIVATATADSNSVILNEWNHLASVWDGSDIRFYSRGILVGTTPASGTIPTTSNPFLIGKSEAYKRQFNGLIDEVRIYNYAKTQSQIQADMRKCTPSTPTAAAGPTPTTPTTPPANCIYFNTGAWTNLSSVFTNGTEIYGGTNNKYSGTAYMYLWLSFDSPQANISLRPCPDDLDPQTGEPNWGDRAGLEIEEISSTELRSRLTADFVPYELRAGLKGPYSYRIIVTAPDQGYHSSYIFSFDTSPNYAIGWGNVDAYDWLARVRVCNLG